MSRHRDDFLNAVYFRRSTSTLGLTNELIICIVTNSLHFVLITSIGWIDSLILMNVQ